ncbi:hypothetical protein [Roseibacillus persicicus]|uniref:hypothetical protein n=1 Tax=Roseibacillus persicicus TaxID=454148 RepID=UPI00281058D3|nr:hypothetical protein [Roseibacillus persicicus]MDQ8188998.1 hypothetical protein [Roseibacillus persicicus]
MTSSSLKPMIAVTSVICAASFIASCGPVPPAEPAEENPFRDMPNSAMAARSGISLEKLHDGWGLYMRKCGECHQKKHPQDISDEGWQKIVPHMSWNAGLSEDEEQDLLNYLKAANSEAPQTGSPTNALP